MRSGLLDRYYKEEDDRRAKQFEQQFSLFEKMIEKKIENQNNIHAINVEFEVITAFNEEVTSTTRLNSKNSKYLLKNIMTGKVQKLFSFKNDTVFLTLNPRGLTGYVYRKDEKIPLNCFYEQGFLPGDLIFIEKDNTQIIGSYENIFVEKPITKPPKKIKQTLQPYLYSLIIHMAFFSIGGMMGLLKEDTKKITKQGLDTFVSIDISKLKEVPSSKDEKKIASSKNKRKKKKNRKVKKLKRRKKTLLTKATSNHVTSKKIKRKATPPSVASSSVFKSLGGISPSKGNGKKIKRVLAAVSNIKGVKSSKVGVFNISGAIGKTKGKDLYIAKGGAVSLKSMVSSKGGRSRTGYASHLGQSANTNAVAGAIVDFPEEEEGKILAGKGSLSRAQILRVIERNASSFRYCYERQLVRHPNLQGKVILSWTIGMSGEVNQAKWKASQIKSRSVNTCLVSKLLALNFPKPKMNPVTIDFPFVFSSSAL